MKQKKLCQLITDLNKKLTQLECHYENSYQHFDTNYKHFVSFIDKIIFLKSDLEPVQIIRVIEHELDEYWTKIGIREGEYKQIKRALGSIKEIAKEEDEEVWIIVEEIKKHYGEIRQKKRKALDIIVSLQNIYEKYTPEEL